MTCVQLANCGSESTLQRRYSPYCRFVEVSAAVPQAYFNVAASVQTNGSTMTFSHERVYLELRRKGIEETLITTYNAWRRDANGAIGFYFDDTMFATAGYYIGDVYIDCVYCFSVQLYVPSCAASVVSCYTIPVLETCGAGECGLAASVGDDAIGGVSCPPAASDCGPIAPYFPLDNPIPPAPAGPASPCCLPQSTAGLDTIG